VVWDAENVGTKVHANAGSFVAMHGGVAMQDALQQQNL